MRNQLLSLALVVSMCPLSAFAAEPQSPCNLLDKDALATLNLVDSQSKVEHKLVPAAHGGPSQRVSVCTISPRNAALPSLSVTTAALPPGAKGAKPDCNWQSIAGVGVELATCTAVENNTFLTLGFTTKGAPDAAAKGRLRALVDRMAGQLAVRAL